MRLIVKQREPLTITGTRTASTTNLSTSTSARDAFDQIDKVTVRKQLAEEQGFLCAFCMRRINHDAKDVRGEPTMKIAHRRPVNSESSSALTWDNLLGSCDGGQRSNGRHCSCDYAQGATALTVDPTKSSSISRLRYERRDAKTGLFITSDDSVLRVDIEETLGLNDGDLPNLREQAWKAFQETQRRVSPNAPYGKPGWREFLPKWREESPGKLRQFLGVIEAKLA